MNQASEGFGVGASKLEGGGIVSDLYQKVIYFS
jgi:hypothetical protein